MRNPNGFGSVSKLSGKRRKPYMARITTGWTSDEKTGRAIQQFKILGYYASKAEAIKALSYFHENPYDVEQKITFAEIFDKWSDRHFTKISQKNALDYTAAFKTSSMLHDMVFADIRTNHLQAVVDNSGKNYPTLRKLKNLLNQLYKFALENDVVSKNYAQFVDIGKKGEAKTIRKPFTDKEIKYLFECVDRMPFVDTVLIMIYTGMRVGELLTIENENINLEERYLRGGIKTEAGINRVIPLSRKIEQFIKQRINSSNTFLISTEDNEQMSYGNYYNDYFKKIMEQLGMDHKPHDCRHTFASLMDSAGANKLCIKRIMGHASNDITDKVYTHKDITELIEAIDLL